MSLDHLEMKYAGGGRVSAPHALAAVNRAMGHVKRGNHAAAVEELMRSPDAMAHPLVQQALPILQRSAMPKMAGGGKVHEVFGLLQKLRQMVGQGVDPRTVDGLEHTVHNPPKGADPSAPGGHYDQVGQQIRDTIQQSHTGDEFAEGGPVSHLQYGINTSSPASPGVSGAIKDALGAIRSYFIDAPRRQIQQDRQEYIDKVANGEAPGYADGGKVNLLQEMLKILTEHAGMSSDQATQVLSKYRAQTGQVMPVAKQMANDIVSGGVRTNQLQKTPAQLAQQLRAGFVPPEDFNHLMYTDPALTPLINRYRAGIDNQNLTASQKQALIEKLSQMGGRPVPPQLPPAALSPQQTDAVLTGVQQ